MTSVFRSFIALEINPDVRAALAHIQNEFKKETSGVSWVLPENIHLTLIFLGDVLEENVPELCRRLDESAFQVPDFKFQVSGMGLFGPTRAPRVVWAGVPEPPPELHQLFERAAAAVRGLGYKLESRPFTPHITLGRIRAAKHVRELTSRAAAHKDTAFGEVGVRRLLLMRSHRDEPKARYSILHESPLKGT